MTDKELAKLSRAELLEMLLAQTKEVDRLKEKVRKLSAETESKRIAISNSGSIAEAALKLNGVFEAAEKAAKQYIDNVAYLYECADSNGEILMDNYDSIYSDTKSRCEKMENDTAEKCRQLVEQAEKEAEKIINDANEQALVCWLDSSKKINALVADDKRSRIIDKLSGQED